mmetsp:Transcript_11687/g.34139  ORF Transcript_11687/g.34139 Transcript_11687/m.34139 type:complete len:300 (-) Transcript_11687:523-1422(-)
MHAAVLAGLWAPAAHRFLAARAPASVLLPAGGVLVPVHLPVGSSLLPGVLAEHPQLSPLGHARGLRGQVLHQPGGARAQARGRPRARGLPGALAAACHLLEPALLQQALVRLRGGKLVTLEEGPGLYHVPALVASGGSCHFRPCDLRQVPSYRRGGLLPPGLACVRYPICLLDHDSCRPHPAAPGPPPPGAAPADPRLQHFQGRLLLLFKRACAARHGSRPPVRPRARLQNPGRLVRGRQGDGLPGWFAAALAKVLRPRRARRARPREPRAGPAGAGGAGADAVQAPRRDRRARILALL